MICELLNIDNQKCNNMYDKELCDRLSSDCNNQSKKNLRKKDLYNKYFTLV